MNPRLPDRADRPDPRRLPRRAGDLEGADAAAHAADVGHERDPRHRHRRRDHRRRRSTASRPGCGSSRSPRSRSPPATSSAASSSPTGCSRCSSRRRRRRPEEAEGRVSRTDWIYLAYLVTIVCFIVALQFLSHPARARQRQPDRRLRHGRRDRRDVLHAAPDELRVDPGRDGGRGAGRGVRVAHREDDRDAGDGGAVQRRRRRRGRARRARGLPQLDPGARQARLRRPRSRSSSPR